MANITSIVLLTPNSVRLTWAGSMGDYEIWWKSDHPAGQEFVFLALVTGTTYDVGSLNWTTTYYFKIRLVGDEFGNFVEVFIQCGQGFWERDTPPSTTQWQPGVALGPDGSFAFSFIARDGTTVAIYLWQELAGWSFFEEFEAPFTYTEPFNMSYSADKVTMTPFTQWQAHHWLFTHLNKVAAHSWENADPQLSHYSIEGNALNTTGRTVAIMHKGTANPWFYAAVSYDWGASFEDLVLIIPGFVDYPDTSPLTLTSYREGPDAVIWIANVGTNYVDWPLSYDTIEQVNIYKYIVGVGCTLFATFGNNVSDWTENMLVLAIEDQKLAVYFVDEKYLPEGFNELPSVAVSTDNGVNWTIKRVDWGDKGFTAGKIVISNGNIILFSKTTTHEYKIYRSTDDGDTWNMVYGFPLDEWYLPFYRFSSMDAVGQYVAFTSCDLQKKPVEDNNAGVLWSEDSGLTWTWIETPDSIQYTDIMDTYTPL